MYLLCSSLLWFCLFQAEDGIRDLVRSRGLGDVYKRQAPVRIGDVARVELVPDERRGIADLDGEGDVVAGICLLYTSDAADERSSVDLGGRRIIKKKKQLQSDACRLLSQLCTQLLSR